MPRLAIVISAVGSVESLETTLVSVLENRPSDCEIVVALKRPYADPYDLKDEVRFLEPRKRLTTIEGINAAVAATNSPFVHVLASGCTVTDGWADAALSRFGDRRVAAVVPWVGSADNAERIVAVGVGYHARGQRHLIGKGASVEGYVPPASVIGPPLFAAFYRKAALEILGGLSGQLTPRQADVDLALLLKQAGLTSVIESRSRLQATSEVDLAEGSLREALGEERLFWRNRDSAPGVSSLLSHLAMASWDVLRAMPRPAAATRLTGRLWGALSFGSHARHRRLVAELAARAVPPAKSNEHVRIDRSHGVPTRLEGAPARVPIR